MRYSGSIEQSASTIAISGRRPGLMVTSAALAKPVAKPALVSDLPLALLPAIALTLTKRYDKAGGQS